MQDCAAEQNFMNFLQLEKDGSQFEENSSQLIISNQENPSLTQIADLNLMPSGHQAKKMKKRKRVDFHYKRRRRSNKNSELNNTAPFNFNEDQKILSLVLEHGPKFSVVSRYFNDRNQNAIKNRYYKYLRFRWDQVLGNDYLHLNCRKEGDLYPSQDIEQTIQEMNFFPEVTDILSSFVQRVHSYFN
ncbi:unnamed protein product [Paramecium octaurelia]|uniref:HTH myb-type domain-containing protein n=1 Tax=Paramecium octaurelia TaxID=43137 RepID=A0A8S1YAX2_PAROT|nr:unnamed protein product [Paramecium octaurelia]CAD8211225.1 unnamed protein product [Paramecium octaurelia]